MPGFQDLKDTLSKRRGGLDNFGIVLSDDKVITALTAPCVAQLPRMRDKIKGEVKIKYFMSFFHNKKVKKDVGIRYIRWLKTSSPWKNTFTSKAVYKAWKEPVTFKVNVPVQYMISAHIAMRYMQEYPVRVEFWDELCSYLTPELAFVLTHYICRRDDKIYPNYLGGHSAFSTFTQHGLQRYLDKAKPYKNPEGTVKDKALEYRGLCKVWNGYEPDPISKFIKEPRLGNVEVDNGWGKVVMQNMSEMKNIKELALSFLKRNNINNPDNYILS